MRISTNPAAMAICLTLTGCGGQQAGFSDRDRTEANQKLANSVMTQDGVPGIAIAILRDGKLFQKLELGQANLATREKVSSATPFQLASTTKIFSSAGVLLLVADGKVRLDDPIGDHLDGLPAAWRGVTIRQLLSYTSGLPDITLETGDVDLVADTWERARDIVANRPFQFQPGHGWAYSQTNYALLLRLIERKSGSTFEDFLAERIFKPLGMRNTFFPGSGRRCAVNYERKKNGQIIKRDLPFPHYVHGAGGLCSSLDDLIIWNSALDSGKIIPANLLKQAWVPTRLANGSNAIVGPQTSYGLGWAIDTTPGKRWAGHSGGNSTAFRRYPNDRLTIIVLHNGASDPDAIASSVAQLMFQQTAAGDAQANLWDSAEGGDQAAVEEALNAGADVNALDTRSSRNGRFALNWAALNNHPEIIKLLLAKGAAVNGQNLTGYTALHHAAEAGSESAARALLAAGADPNIRNANGATAAEVARANGHGAVADLLEKTRARSG